MKLPWKLGRKFGCVKGRIVKMQGKGRGWYLNSLLLDYV